MHHLSRWRSDTVAYPTSVVGDTVDNTACPESRAVKRAEAQEATVFLDPLTLNTQAEGSRVLCRGLRYLSYPR